MAEKDKKHEHRWELFREGQTASVERCAVCFKKKGETGDSDEK